MTLKTMISTLQKVSKWLPCLALLLFLPLTGHAQESVSYTVSPTIFDMTANPGQTFRSTVRIINTNPFELHIYIDKANFIPKGEEGVPQFIPLEENTSEQSTFAQWIDSDKELIIAPEQTVELPFTISVPQNGAPGGHFAALLISTKPTVDPSDITKVQTAQTISSLLFLRVTGDITENSTIRSFRTSHYLLSKPEATFELRIENKGNVHVQPQGEIKIYNMWGKERGTIPVNQQTLFGNVLPNSVRKYAFNWSSEWAISDMGRYTAVATLAYGVDTRQFMTADTAFWIIPWKFLLTIIVVVGGFVALLTWGIKLYVRRMLALAGVSPQLRSESAAAPVIAEKKKGRPKKSETVKEKTKRVAAPIEAGILDLRGRLQQPRSIKEQLRIVLLFVRQYWKFFAVALASLVFLVLVILFFKGAFAPSRDFEVTIQNQGQNIKVNNTNGITTEAAPEKPAPAATVVSIVNRSGDPALSDLVRNTLQDKHFVVGSTTSEFSTTDDKTVIVYKTSDANTALALSKLFNNALLSAYSDEQAADGIVIYIGKDLKTAP